MSKDNSEITAQEETEEPPIKLESISHTPNTRPLQSDDAASQEDGALSDLTSAMSSTYTSFTSFLNRGATDLSEATNKVEHHSLQGGMLLPSQIKNIAAGGTEMVTKLTGGLTDFISHGLPGFDDEEVQQPSFEYLQKTYGIANTDSLIACFSCELKQNYGPTLNTFSPDFQVSFPLKVSVTEETLCLMVESSDSEYPGKISREEIVAITSEKDSLLLKLTDDRRVELTKFRNTELRVYAFKLMQHLLPKL